jgi:hypothetical protein
MRNMGGMYCYRVLDIAENRWAVRWKDAGVLCVTEAFAFSGQSIDMTAHII